MHSQRNTDQASIKTYCVYCTTMPESSVYLFFWPASMRDVLFPLLLFIGKTQCSRLSQFKTEYSPHRRHVSVSKKLPSKFYPSLTVHRHYQWTHQALLLSESKCTLSGPDRQSRQPTSVYGRHFGCYLTSTPNSLPSSDPMKTWHWKLSSNFIKGNFNSVYVVVNSDNSTWFKTFLCCN